MNPEYGATPQPEEGRAGAQQPMGQDAKSSYRPSIRELLEKETVSQDKKSSRTHRALDILRAHPEFEEFIELLELLNRNVIG